ncbi:MAG: acyl carrier protein [Planctomycetes bacterium]|nr:acyl carrier protein [Planctomycetota bacterium]
MPDARAEIIAAVREYLAQNFLYDRKDLRLEGDSSFTANKVLDSLGVMALLGHLEGTYGIAIEESDLTVENLDSLDRIAAFVLRKRALV